MPSRKDIGKRVRMKSLKKLNAKKKNNPEDYIHETTEKSLYLAMKYDNDRGLLAEFKKPQFEELRKKFENNVQDKQTSNNLPVLQ